MSHVTGQPLKCGILMRYKRCLFRRNWREEFVVLLADSSIVWYKDSKQRQIQGIVRLNEAPEFMAVGCHTSKIPRRPRLPPGNDPSQLMAFATASRKKIYWFLATSEKEVSDWITAISFTLPLPPEVHFYDPAERSDNVRPTNDKTCDESSTVETKTAKPNQLGLNDVTMGLLAATGVSVCGWGSGLGWTKHWSYHSIAHNSFVGSFPEASSLPCLDVHHLNNPLFLDSNHEADVHDYYDDDYHDNDFDMDFGGDMGF